MSHPFTDIVLPVHNALHYLKICVDLICKSTNNYRIIFVDDYCDAETKEYLQAAIRDHKDWLLLQTGKQKWFTRASNLGLRLVKTERAVLINSDCTVGPGWLQEMYDVWDEVRAGNSIVNIGIVGSVTHDENAAYRWRPTDGKLGEYISGHCYLLSMSAMADMARRRGHEGWYFNEKDVSQIHINSDRIMCWEMNQAGYATIGCYKAPVGHHGGKSWGHQLHIIPQRLEDVD